MMVNAHGRQGGGGAMECNRIIVASRDLASIVRTKSARLQLLPVFALLFRIRDRVIVPA